MIYANTYELTDVANFCVERLDISRDLDINISVCCLKQDGALGWCYDIFDNEADIELEITMDREKTILTLCHEMVHVKQADRGDDEFCEEEAHRMESQLYDEYISR